MAPRIPFGYKEFVDALAEAIDKEADNGATVVDKQEVVYTEALNFNKVYEEAKSIWTQLIQKAGDDEESQLRMLQQMNKKIEMVFGRNLKLSEVTEDQVDLLNLVVLDLKTLL